MEAMAFRTPVIATAICGIPELIVNNVSGLLVDPDDVDALAASIEKLLAHEDLRLEFTKNAYQKVHQDFDLKKETGKILELWKAAA